ncbi:MAG: TonB-dependent receptor [Calditrichaeota bacterium]|nr:TonB-dependent receptor [Calditrichota bacterium]
MKKIRWFAVLAILLTLPGVQTYAGVTGKIQGKVVDKNGMPLPGVNVLLVGTNRGAATDSKGNYVILSVAPGVYKVSARMIGFEILTKTGVMVQADRSTIVNFKLMPKVLGMKEVVVTAEKPKVEVDRTFSEYTVGSKEIQQTVMMKNVADIVSLQPGMDVNGRGMVRGGDMNDIAADVTYYVDGVRMINSDGLGVHNFTGVNKYVIESASVITGGLNAEYGNAQGGVINIVTKEGGHTYHGTMELGLSFPGQHHWGPNYYDAPIHRDHMKWGNAAWESEIDSLTGKVIHKRVDYVNLWGQSLQASISGPIFRNLSFFLSTQYSHEAIHGINPLKHVPFNTQNNWKLSYAITPSISVKLGGLYSYHWGFNSGPSVGGIKSMGDNGKNIFLPMNSSSAGKSLYTDHMEYFSLTHMITPRTYYELRISNYVTLQKSKDVPDSTTPIRKDLEGWFNLPRKANSYVETQRKRLGIKFDLSSQVTDHHFVKTGIDYTGFNVWAIGYDDFLDRRYLTYIGKDHKPKSPIKPQQYAWYIQDKMEYKGLVVNAGIRMDRFDPNIDYPATVSLGASDYFFNTFTRFDYKKLREFGLLRKIKPKIVWSPRLGVAHPITDRSMIHFFYGHIYQLPSFYTMFAERWENYGERDKDINGNGVIDPTEKYNTISALHGFFGNPELGYEKTISFELGFDWNFYSEYVVSLSSYYKSSSNQVTSPGRVHVNWWDPAKQMFDFKFTHKASNGVHEDIQGFELSLRKSFSHYFSFRLAYNLQWAVQGQAGLADNFYVPDSAFTVNKFWMNYKKMEDGSEEPVKLISFLARSYGHKANMFLDSLRAIGLNPVPLGNSGIYHVDFWGASEEDPKPNADIRSYGKAQIFIGTPSHFGPWGLLSDLSLNIIYKMSTGVPYLYSPIGKTAEWRNAPLATRTDLSLEKILFQKGKLKPTFYMEIVNVFNQKDFRNDGGFKSMYGPGEFVRWGMDRPRPDNKEYQEYGDFYANYRYYGSPRAMRMGIRLMF